MNIKQLTAKIDKKLAELEKQRNSLQKQISQHSINATNSTNEANNAELKTKEEITQLEHLIFKLKQSKDIAIRAHELQTNNDKKRLQRQNHLALGLIIFSLLGLAGIVLTIIFR